MCDRLWEHGGGLLTEVVVAVMMEMLVMAVVAMTVVMMVRMALVQSTDQL